MPIPPKVDPVKNCKACGQPLVRKRYGKRLEDRTRFLAREHCNQSCANSREAVQADSHRWKARQIKPRERCTRCGAMNSLHVHHKDRNPANNALENLTVLCASCHLKLHWAEDREARLEAKRIGESMNRRLGAGKWSWVVKRQLLPKLQAEMADTGSVHVSRSS